MNYNVFSLTFPHLKTNDIRSKVNANVLIVALRYSYKMTEQRLLASRDRNLTSAF